MFRRILTIAVLAALVLLLLIQLVPYGRDHSNPPVVAEPKWDSPATRALAKRACFDCHSNETVWPWYSNVAPASWLLAWDISRAKEEFSFSEWQPGLVRAEKAAKVVREGTMPPRQYLLMHPEAQLTAAERAQLANGLQNSLQ